MCVYAAAMARVLTSANHGEAFGLQNDVTELIKERHIYADGEGQH